MFEILEKKVLHKMATLMKIRAPLVAKNVLPGQFLILRVSKDGERIPLTVFDYDRVLGFVVIVFQVVGATTVMLNSLNEGDKLCDVLGPLGKPSKLDGFKRVCVVSGGLGCANTFSVAKYLKNMGSEVFVISGFRMKNLVILEKTFKHEFENFVVVTDDGSYGKKGLVTDELKCLLHSGCKFDLIFVAGPLIMMKFVCELTKKFGVKTVVSMNPIMIDGTGMCGSCRIMVGNVLKFACVDGPDFDGHLINFDESIRRLKFYSKFEKKAFSKACNLLNSNNSNAEFVSKKTEMLAQNANSRIGNFNEVALGYDEQQAVKEAKRCLNCKNKPCSKKCPVAIDIPAFIEQVSIKNFKKAYDIIAKSSMLPGVCGRVCPQELQCEGGCVRGLKGESVAIGNLERFVADWYAKNYNFENVAVKKNGKKVAIVGSGPAGISCAGELLKFGFDVFIFEALHLPGGVLVYGIPEFRLPKKIVEREILNLKRLGAKIQTNVLIGSTLTLQQLFDEGFCAVFIGMGAGVPKFLGVEGENLNGIYCANEFLTRINLMNANSLEAFTPIHRAKNCAIIGGGNVAMDAARCAKRLGAENVYLIYRRGQEHMPARLEEIKNAKEEGIIFKFFCNPVKFCGNDNGFVDKIICQRTKLDDSLNLKQSKVVVIENSEFEMEIDGVVVAIGTLPNSIVRNDSFGLSVSEFGGVLVDENGLTSRKCVYAGGDVVSGSATVILAMEAGKKAAAAINDQFG